MVFTFFCTGAIRYRFEHCPRRSQLPHKRGHTHHHLRITSAPPCHPSVRSDTSNAVPLKLGLRNLLSVNSWKYMFIIARMVSCGPPTSTTKQNLVPVPPTCIGRMQYDPTSTTRRISQIVGSRTRFVIYCPNLKYGLKLNLDRPTFPWDCFDNSNSQGRTARGDYSEVSSRNTASTVKIFHIRLLLFAPNSSWYCSSINGSLEPITPCSSGIPMTNH